MLRALRITLLIVTLLFAVLAGLFFLSRSRTFQVFGELIHRGETDEKIVALTFDDAPTAYTNDVLQILAEKQIKGTFYVIGSSTERFPEITRSIVEQGHELGNHSYSHERFLLKSQAFIANELETTNRLIRAAGYTGEITFRPPNGKKLFGLPWYLQQHQIKTIMWDVEPDTYHTGDAPAIRTYVQQHTRPGSIVLLHPFCPQTCQADREALPLIIDDLRAAGYRFVTISELLERTNKSRQDNLIRR